MTGGKKLESGDPVIPIERITRAIVLLGGRRYRPYAFTEQGIAMLSSVLRSATSVGAQYREAQRAKSISDFISKSEGALQEIDETACWLELIDGSAINSSGTVKALRAEAEQLLAMFVSITGNAKENRKDR